MKVSLINPNLSGDVSILDMSLTYLGTYLNQRTGHECNTIDFTFHRRDWERHLRKKLNEQSPEVVGIAAPSMYMKYVRGMAREVKKYGPVRIIIGGCHPTLEPDESLRARGGCRLYR